MVADKDIRLEVCSLWGLWLRPFQTWCSLTLIDNSGLIEQEVQGLVLLGTVLFSDCVFCWYLQLSQIHFLTSLALFKNAG